ncbi:MAG: sugar phosphate nucleotidyltransferase [Promethearchaeota archaeon]
MIAVILAGGYGIRLRPLTCSRPKQLLPLADSTLVGYILKQLQQVGITEIILATGSNGSAIQDYLSDGAKHDLTIHYSIEKRPLGTAGAIKLAESYLPDDAPFLVVNGDIVSDLPFHHLLQYHREHQATATLALYRVEDPTRFGVVDIASNGRIHQFIEKPDPDHAPTNLINAGCYVLEPTVLDYISPNQTASLEYDVFPLLCKKSPVFGWEHHGLWIDTGTPLSFLEAHHALRTALHKTPYLGSDTTIATEVTVEPDVTIGNRVTIGTHSRISNSVIFDDVIIEQGVIIDHSIVGQGAIIGKDIRLESYTIVGDKAIIDSGAIIPPGALICPEYRIEKNCKAPHCFVKNLPIL